MALVMRQYDVFLVCLDPVVGREMKKTRPCVIVSPDEMNGSIGTVIVAPMTTASHPWPTRVPLRFQGKAGWIVLDQLRTVDKGRLAARLGKIGAREIAALKDILREMLVE